MSTTTLPPETNTAAAIARPQITVSNANPPRKGWTSWVTTTDHKKIGIMYMVFAFAFFIIGGVEALLMRIQLGVPDNSFVDPQTYNGLLTMHGTTMVFLFVMPMMAGLANYMVPLMIGARDMAFPRLNALSFWLLTMGAVVFYGSLLFSPPEAGWTSYAPLSNLAYSPTGGIDAWIFLIHLTGIASILAAINFCATITNMRAPGMGWSRLPLFCWTILIQSVVVILAFPTIACAVTLLLTDRHFGTNFFNPTAGGSPLLWQHLFWFFGHPEVYIMILPAFGIISEVLPVFARKPIFGYKAIVASAMAIAFLGLLVWAHHMFTTPTATVILAFFTIGSMLIAIPTGVKIFNWIATLWRGSIITSAALHFACGFLLLFVIGGISGIMLAIFPIDWQLHDSYFVVAHFHYVLVAGAVNAIFAGIYYWFPKITGRMMSESMGKLSFWMTFIGFNVTFLVQHSLGLSGMPRRVYEYASGNDWGTYNMISTVGSFLLAAGVILTAYNAVRSLRKGPVAGPDPWKANTLEWFTSSPPPPHNFDVVPRVRSVEPMKDIRRQVERASQPATSDHPSVSA